MKLKEILSRDEKAVKADELDLNVASAKLQVEGDIISAQRRVNTLEISLNDTIGTPFSPAKYINAKRELAAAKEDLADLESLKADLF